MADWYYREMGEVFGPFTAQQMREKRDAGKLTPDCEFRKGEEVDWRSAFKVGEFSEER